MEVVRKHHILKKLRPSKSERQNAVYFFLKIEKVRKINFNMYV